jgi:hypothetical protein
MRKALLVAVVFLIRRASPRRRRRRRNVTDPGGREAKHSAKTGGEMTQPAIPLPSR